MKTLTAFYDLAVGPVSFDVIAFLIQAKSAMQDQGCERLHVVIVPDVNGVDGMFRNKLALYGAPEKHWRLWNIVIPACRLVGATMTLATDWQQAERLQGDAVWPDDWRKQSLRNRHHLTRPIIERARHGQPVPWLRAMDYACQKVREFIAIDGRPMVTVTIRNTYDASRNTDQALCGDIARILGGAYQVMQLRDTSDALSAGQGYGELNLELRVALYQAAVMNIQPHGGTSVLCWFADAPFLMFMDHSQSANCGKVWTDNTGLNMGEQLPWARPDQRIVYQEASVDHINAALQTWRQSAVH